MGAGHFAALHHLIEGESQAMALPQSGPSNSRRQSLEMDSRNAPISSQLCKWGSAGDEFAHFGIGLVNVFRISRQRHPAEGTDAAAEQRPDVFRTKPGTSKAWATPASRATCLMLFSVVENRKSHLLESQQVLDVLRHGRGCSRRGSGGIARPPLIPLLDRPPLGQIAIDGIVRRRLIGHRIRLMPRSSSACRTSTILPRSAIEMGFEFFLARSSIASASSREFACAST